MRSVCVGVLVVILVVACSSTPSVQVACEHLFDARSAWSARCLLGMDSARRDAFVASCVGTATATGSLVTPADIEACARSYGDRCLSPGPICSGGIGGLFPNGEKKGTLEKGAPCFANVQCKTGWCPLTTTSGCATCSAPPASSRLKEGEICQLHGSNCEEGLYCKPTSAITGVCDRGAPLGAACMPGGPFCERGLYCDATNRCVPLIDDGRPCDRGTGCKSACHDGICGPNIDGIGGERCDANTPCAQAYDCVNDVCVEHPRLAAGSTCKAERDCAAGSGCKFPCTPTATSGTCTVDTAGSACGFLDSCSPGFACQGEIDWAQSRCGNCVRLGMRAGEPCPCGVDLACKDGTCIPWGDAVCRRSM